MLAAPGKGQQGRAPATGGRSSGASLLGIGNDTKVAPFAAAGRRAFPGPVAGSPFPRRRPVPIGADRPVRPANQVFTVSASGRGFRTSGASSVTMRVWPTPIASPVSVSGIITW